MAGKKNQTCQVITIKMSYLMSSVKDSVFWIKKIQKIGLLLFTKIIFTVTHQGSE